MVAKESLFWLRLPLGVPAGGPPGFLSAQPLSSKRPVSTALPSFITLKHWPGAVNSAAPWAQPAVGRGLLEMEVDLE